MLAALFEFVHQVGPVFWLILLLSLWLWQLLLRGFQGQWRRAAEVEASLAERWQFWRRQPWRRAEPVRRLLLADYRYWQGRHLGTIRMLINLLPLLGLLGTVDGMVSIFSEIERLGMDPRYFSKGIAQALLTTLAGLAAALSGLWFLHLLERRGREQLNRLRRQLPRQLHREETAHG